MPNLYTGTANDPHQQAQHNYLGPDWERYFKFLNGKKLLPQSLGIGATQGLLPRPGDEDIARSGVTNAYLGEIQDSRDPLTNRPLDIAEAQLRQMREQSDVKRALAVANDPHTSASGRTILGETGGPRATAGATGEPVNRQALAAQMAPGLIAPPAPGKPVTFDDPKPLMVNGKSTMTRAGSDGQIYGIDRKPITEGIEAEPPNTDVADTVAGMMSGTLPPQLPGRASKEYTAIMGEAKRQGYDLARAATDWSATQKHIQTMNGAQQLRLNQAVNALPEMLDSVDALASQWKGGKFPILNKANLALAKGGAFGPEASSIANQLDAQIADVTADLGNVYMGGNSPTDHALSLAEKSLKGNWDERVIHDMVKLAKQNVQIRRNSINNTGVAGASEDNPYGNQPPAAPAAMEEWTRDASGKLVKKGKG